MKSGTLITTALALSAFVFIILIQSSSALNHSCNYTCANTNASNCSFFSTHNLFAANCNARKRVLTILNKLGNTAPVDYVSGAAQLRHVDFRNGSGINYYPYYLKKVCQDANALISSGKVLDNGKTNCYSNIDLYSGDQDSIKGKPLEVKNVYEVMGFFSELIVTAADKYRNNIDGHASKNYYPDLCNNSASTYYLGDWLRSITIVPSNINNATINTNTRGFVGNYTWDTSFILRHFVNATNAPTSTLDDNNRDLNTNASPVRNDLIYRLKNIINDDNFTTEIFGLGMVSDGCAQFYQNSSLQQSMIDNSAYQFY